MKDLGSSRRLSPFFSPVVVAQKKTATNATSTGRCCTINYKLCITVSVRLPPGSIAMMGFSNHPIRGS
jgi:hypothetical protein